MQQNNAVINFTTRNSDDGGVTFMNHIEVNVNNQGYSTIYQGSSKTDIVWNNSQTIFNTLGEQNLKVKYITAGNATIYFREYKIIVVPASQKLFKDSYCNTMRLWEGSNPTNEIPLILTEGFDSYNTRTEEYYRYAGDKLVNCLNAKGFKVYILNYKYNSQDIRNNAAVYASAIKYISSINNNMQIIAAGISMGGVISRYALAKAENDGTPLPVTKWVSIDAPQQGAHIPHDFQDFHKKSTEDNSFAAHASNNDAAKELLKYNAFEPDGSIHTTFYNELNGLNSNGYPHLTENIGVSFSNAQSNNINGIWLQVECGNCPHFVEMAADLPKYFNLQSDDIIAGSKLPKIEMEPIGLEQSSWGGSLIQINTPNQQEVVFTAGGTSGENYPTFIPHVSSLDITNGQSKFDLKIIPAATSFHDVVSDDIIEPLISALIKDNVYLQNKTITDTKHYLANKTISVGKNVTNIVPQGNYIIASTANVTMQADEEIVFLDGFVSEGELYAFIAPIDIDCGDGITVSQNKTSNPDSTSSRETGNSVTMGNSTGEEAKGEELVDKNTQQEIQNNKHPIPSQQSTISNQQFHLYPNPTSGTLQMDYRLQENETGELIIYDITGRKVKRYTLTTQNNTLKIQDSELKDGMYLYHVVVNGEIMASEKLVVIK